MYRMLKYFLCFFIITLSTLSYAASPSGLWRTIDDSTGRPKAIVRIIESGNSLSGQVVRLLPGPGYKPNPICSKCQGARKNKPVIGMVIMQGLTRDHGNPNIWSGGTILDPKNGKIYRCTVELVGNGNVLKVRGYVGISILGRTQTWVRGG